MPIPTLLSASSLSPPSLSAPAAGFLSGIGVFGALVCAALAAAPPWIARFAAMRAARRAEPSPMSAGWAVFAGTLAAGLLLALLAGHSGGSAGISKAAGWCALFGAVSGSVVFGLFFPQISEASGTARRWAAALRKTAPIPKAAASRTGADVLDVLDGAAGAAEIDALEIEFRGVRLRVVSILHGLTGGTSREYVEAVERALASRPAGTPCFGEKSTKALYAGVDEELDDWIPLTARAAMGLGAVFTSRPWRLLWTGWAALRERASKTSRFLAMGAGTMGDIGGSVRFHALDPWLRRRLAGFPHPAEYLRIDLSRRVGTGSLGWKCPGFPDPDWRWMRWIEPHACIPARSLHMLAYAAERTRRMGKGEAVVVCGELHGTDMAWFSQEWDPAAFSPEEAGRIEAILDRGRRWAAEKTPWTEGWARVRYLSLTILGSWIGLAPWLAGAFVLSA